jgi:hypothetical protein
LPFCSDWTSIRKAGRNGDKRSIRDFDTPSKMSWEGNEHLFEPSLHKTSLHGLTGLPKRERRRIHQSHWMYHHATSCRAEKVSLKHRKTDKRNGVTIRMALSDGRYTEQASKPQASGGRITEKANASCNDEDMPTLVRLLRRNRNKSDER